MYVESVNGLVKAEHLSKAERTLVGRHHNAVKHFLETGDASRLRKFEGVSVNGVEFETDLSEIEESALENELDFENVYPVTS